MTTHVERALRAKRDQPLVDLAESQIKRATDNYTASAKEILRQAVVGVDQLIRGHELDAERLMYLAYVADALEMILEGINPEKAFGLASGNRPKLDTFQRDFMLFVKTGRALSKLEVAGSLADAPIKTAQREVASKQGFKPATVKKAWEKFGGLTGWEEFDRVQAEGD